MPKARGPDVVFAELYALISAARIQVKQTCAILGISREAWRGYVNQNAGNTDGPAWRMGPAVRARAEKMSGAVRFYIDKGVLPSLDAKIQAAALEKIRARVQGEA